MKIYERGKYRDLSSEEKILEKVVEEAWGHKERKKIEIFEKHVDSVSFTSHLWKIFYPFGLRKMKNGEYRFSWSPRRNEVKVLRFRLRHEN